MTSSNLISHVLETRKFVMAILHWKRLLCDNKRCLISVKPWPTFSCKSNPITAIGPVIGFQRKRQSLFQTFWEKGKIIITSIFPFPSRCFPLYRREISPFVPQLIHRLQILLIFLFLFFFSSGKGLTPY